MFNCCWFELLSMLFVQPGHGNAQDDALNDDLNQWWGFPHLSGTVFSRVSKGLTGSIVV